MRTVATLLSFSVLAAASSESAPGAADGVFAIPLKRIRDQSAYGIDLMVGNLPQNITVLVDTGSPTYSVESPLDKVCQRGLCREFGAFQNTTSTTSIYSGPGFNNIISDLGYGSYLNDSIRAGGHLFPSMRFGYVEEHYRTVERQIVSTFGLGAICQTNDCNSMETFVQALYNRRIITRRAFSLYLGPNDPDSTGTLVIGGIDRAKRQGQVYKREMRDPTHPEALQQPNQIQVVSYSLDRADGSKFDFAYPKDTPSYHLWDSGSPQWYMPTDLFWEVTAYFGLPSTIDSMDTHYEVDCSYRKPTKHALTVSMADDAHIPIPMHTLVTKVGDTCSIDVGPWDGAMGNSFLRGLYVTFDYDTLTLEFAQANYTSETDIVKIE